MRALGEMRAIDIGEESAGCRRIRKRVRLSLDHRFLLPTGSGWRTLD